MKPIDWKKLTPHLVAILIFLLISIIYNSPLLDGKRLVAGDDTQFRGASKDIVDFREKEGKDPLWTNNMFGGMPDYTISFQTKNNFISNIYRPVMSVFPVPVGYMFFAMLGFYVMLIAFGFKPYASAIGAIAYGLCSYNIGVVTAGHYAKYGAIAFFPFIVTGVHIVFQKKNYFWGAALVGLATTLELVTNHPQMTYYYFVFFLSAFLIYHFVKAIIAKEIKHALISAAIVGVMIVAGGAANANRLLPTSEYTAYSTRGGSELKKNVDQADQTGGLPRSYIVGYSSGTDDFMAFLVPNYKGPNSGQLVENPVAKETMGKNRQLVSQVESVTYNNYQELVDQYWGGADSYIPVYSGVLIFVLFLLGFVFVKHPIKWVIIPGFLITLMLSWGKNYMGFTNFFIDNFPLYNKFRAVNSIIIVVTFCIPLLASFLIARLVNEKEFLEEKSIGKYKKKHALVAGLGFVVVLLLAMYVSPRTFQSFTKPSHYNEIAKKDMTEIKLINEAVTTAMLGDVPIEKVDEATKAEIEKTINTVISSMEEARIAIFKKDILRSLLILILGGVVLSLYAFKKVNWQILVGVLGLLILADVWDHDSRYLNSKNFVDKKKANFVATNADNMILADKGPHHRVMNLSVNTFNDATTSYFHKSLGGYSGAKMGRYQELITGYIRPELNQIYASQGRGLDSILPNLQVLNMLNTKYFIFDPNSAPLMNPFANGPVWIVNQIELVDDADGEIEGLSKFDLKKVAVVDKNFKDQIKTATTVRDSNASVILTNHTANSATYDFKSNTDQYLVFSEIYYPLGWNVYVDGTKAEYFRADYILRAMYMPKGTHKIEFMFEPATYKKAETYSLLGSIVVIGVIGLAGFMEYRRRKVKVPKA